MNTAEQIKQKLFNLSDDKKRLFLPYFFKTGQGQYGEGDQFIGVVIPQQRALVKQIKSIKLEEIEKLLHDPYHECRLTALLLLVETYKKASTEEEKKIIFDFYIAHHKFINNWDLVDLSAPQIAGIYLLTHSREKLISYAQSNHLWLQRISIISTYTLIKNHEFNDTFLVADELLDHPHDLIHKAVGWMLREVGKRDFEAEYQFLLTNNRYKKMPRTMLRYAIEKFEESLRQDFLKSRL